MKVIGVNGSPRKDGNTAILIQTVFEELIKEGIETELIQLSGKNIEGCKAYFRWNYSRVPGIFSRCDLSNEGFN
jgi:Multimeric flavodoxin WrbA